LYQIFPEKEASVMAAVLLGDKAGVDADLKALYQKNGIIHILSISGLHITLIGMGLYKILRRAGVSVWCAAAGGAIFLILYGVMTGLGVSACRAIGMYLLRMLAQLLGRTYDMLTAIGVTAVCMVCLHPAWLEHMGFLLSYGSVLGVGILLPALAESGEEAPRVKRYIEEKWKRRLVSLYGRLWRGLRQSLLAGISITLTTLPIQLWFAYEIPVYSILLNVLVLPFMSVVMATGLFAMLIPGMGFVGTVDVLILAGYEKLCAWFGRLPHPMWNPGRPEVWQIAVYYLLWAAVVCCAELSRQRGRKSVQKCMQFVLLGAAVLVLGLSGRCGDRVTFLDVGQGDCICVQLSSGEVYLFDCGSSSRSRIGERVLIPFLKYYGIGKIDAVFVSHGDQDHMNGIVELLNLREQEHIEVGGLVLPGIDRSLWNEEFGELLEAAKGTAGQREIPVSVIRAGESWTGGRQGEDCFLCLHPSAEGDGGGGNEGSACYYIELQEGERRISLMLTGDVEGEGERELLRELQNQGIRDVTLLKAAHHGSRNSTKEELLEQLSPALAVISCGRSNRYGHPHPELLQRLLECDTQILQTPQSGAVTLLLQSDEVMLTVQSP
ncbi:MAG: DNA internalization-related competence protein ComEC/Rec2, partial [Acetatifactor sp.]|nr:DNA internalization-related competence protein ComEC/Rec2 [Acetatifactor sp.]